MTKHLHVHNWIEHRRSGQRFQEVCVDCLKTSDWFEGDKHVTPIHHHREVVPMPIYDGPLESAGADPREHMEYGVGYEWPESGICSVGTCRMHGPITVTKHHWANRPLGQLFSRCPYHQARWAAKVTMP